MHLGLKSKVCIALILLGVSWSFAQTTPDELALEVDAQDSLGPQENTVDNAIEQTFEEESVGQAFDQSAESESGEQQPTEGLEPEDAEAAPAGMVLIEYPQDVDLSYQDRRKTHGSYISFDYEPLFFNSYISPIDGKSFKEIFGESTLPIIRANFEYKFNTSLVAFAAGLFYSMGEATGAVDGVDHKMQLSRYGASFKIALDRITEEPYIVPYLGANVWQGSIKDEVTTESYSKSLPLGTNFVAGLMFQLDWIDDISALESRKSGLKNTFLDVFATKYAAISDDADTPNLETDFIVGGGLRLEF